jgi:hypothetical protein
MNLKSAASSAKRTAWTLGVILPEIEIYWTDRDTSYFNYADEVIYIRNNVGGGLFRELSHEYGHVLFLNATDEIKNRFVQSINDLFETDDDRFRFPHADELFAKTFEHMMMSDEDTPHFEGRVKVWLDVYNSL